MSMIERLKSHVSTLVLGSLLAGVAAYEWKQAKAGEVIPSAQAKPTPARPQSVLAEGRIAVPPGAEITVGAELDGKLLKLLVKEQDRVKAIAQERLAAQFEGREKEISAAFRSLTKKLVRERIIRDGLRIDGRGLTDIRPLSAMTHVLPRVHGSALFERGETQILGVTTLNMLRMEQMIDTLNPERTKRYMHNYNMPPYSTGETGRVGSPKRREIGHGALAERALIPVLPTREEFPYAIRQVSEAISSNGSTSMGSVFLGDCCVELSSHKSFSF